MTTYRIVSPPKYSSIYNVVHVSLLNKYHPNPSHVIQYESLTLERDLTYEEKYIYILEQQVRTLRSRIIPIVKALW